MCYILFKYITKDNIISIWNKNILYLEEVLYSIFNHGDYSRDYFFIGLYYTEFPIRKKTHYSECYIIFSIFFRNKSNS